MSRRRFISSIQLSQGKRENAVNIFKFEKGAIFIFFHSVAKLKKQKNKTITLLNGKQQKKKKQKKKDKPWKNFQHCLKK